MDCPVSTLVHAKAWQPDCKLLRAQCCDDTDEEGEQSDCKPLVQIGLLDEVSRSCFDSTLLPLFVLLQALAAIGWSHRVGKWILSVQSSDFFILVWITVFKSILFVIFVVYLLHAPDQVQSITSEQVRDEPYCAKEPPWTVAEEAGEFDGRSRSRVECHFAFEIFPDFPPIVL